MKPSPARPAVSRPPRGMAAIGVFLLCAAVIAALAGITLAFSGTALDRIWVLNPRAHAQLAPFGKAIGYAFFLLTVTLAIAGIGWFQRRLWGWWLAVSVIATQILGDLVNVSLGRIREGVIGVAIASALLFYLLRTDVRAAFSAKLSDSRE